MINLWIGLNFSRWRLVQFVGLWGTGLLTIGGCVNTSLGQSLSQSLQPDPQLQTSPQSSPQSSPIASPAVTAPTDPPTDTPTSTPSPEPERPAFADRDRVPKELKAYVEDMLAVNVLVTRAIEPPSTKADNAKSQPTQPKQPQLQDPITRREYVRWLVAVNNRFYDITPARQLRAGTGDPAFSDLSKEDLDFGAIQGLAEAGLIASRLSGDTSAKLFRPNDRLTREDLIRWKVPIDKRQALPPATVETVEKTWGFQDAEKISPNALRAIALDFQNGDVSNLRRAFGYTTLLQPQRSVTRAEAIAVLWHFGFQAEGISAQDLLKPKSQPSPIESPNPTNTDPEPSLKSSPDSKPDKPIGP